MIYSQAKVISGGLAHIPIVISVFYFIMSSFNKRAIEFAEANKQIKLKAKVNAFETVVNPVTGVSAETSEGKETKVKKDRTKAKNKLSNKLNEIEKIAEDVKEKVKKRKEKKKKDMKRD